MGAGGGGGGNLVIILVRMCGPTPFIYMGFANRDPFIIYLPFKPTTYKNYLYEGEGLDGVY